MSPFGIRPTIGGPIFSEFRRTVRRSSLRLGPQSFGTVSNGSRPAVASLIEQCRVRVGLTLGGSVPERAAEPTRRPLNCKI